MYAPVHEMLLLWKALNVTQAHDTVHPGSGAEETEISGVGGEGSRRPGFQRLWAPPGDGDILQIPRAGDIGGGQQLTGGGEELVSGKKCLE